MLSLKSLKAELEQLKASQANKVASHTVTTDNKGGQVIQTKFRQGSLFGLWLLSTIISYGHKIPMISRIITLLSLWYGRTTWWRLLVYSRKVFVVINALIGVITVFKITGFSSDNLFAGFAGLGHTYIEIFSSFVTRLFNWFLELFDHKIVPNNKTYNWFNW